MTEIANQVDVAEFSRRVRAARELAGKSTEEVAKALGICTKSLSRTLRGERRLHAGEVHVLALFLGVTESFLLGTGDLRAARTDTFAEAMTELAQLRERLNRTEALFTGNLEADSDLNDWSEKGYRVRVREIIEYDVMLLARSADDAKAIVETENPEVDGGTAIQDGTPHQMICRVAVAAERYHDLE